MANNRPGFTMAKPHNIVASLGVIETDKGKAQGFRVVLEIQK